MVQLCQSSPPITTFFVCCPSDRGDEERTPVGAGEGAGQGPQVQQQHGERRHRGDMPATRVSYDKMAPSDMFAVLLAPSQLYRLLVYFSVLFLLYLPKNVSSIISYDRRALLVIKSAITRHKFDRFNPLFSSPKVVSFIPGASTKKRASVLVRLKRMANHLMLPSIVLANVQSLDNKLQAQSEDFLPAGPERHIICLTETWLMGSMLDLTIQPAGFSIIA